MSDNDRITPVGASVVLIELDPESACNLYYLSNGSMIRGQIHHETAFDMIHRLERQVAIAEIDIKDKCNALTALRARIAGLERIEAIRESLGEEGES